jgi:ATP-dependent Clp protease, protease subunit
MLPLNSAENSFTELLESRTLILDGEIDSDLANRMVACILFLEAEDPDRDIYLYINSPGGSVSAGFAILDTIKQIEPDVHTICNGVAGGMSALLLSVGAKGKRMSLPNSLITICQPLPGVQGQAIDEAIQASEIIYYTGITNALLAENTGQSIEQIERDTGRNLSMSALEAKQYGIIDLVYRSK